MKSYKESLKEMLEDEEFKREYEELQPELDIIRAIADPRISQNLTQRVSRKNWD